MKRAVLENLDDLAILRIDNPPVNALSAETVYDIEAAFDQFERDRSFRGLVIECEGRTFVAGGDIRVFDAEDFSLTTHFNAFLAQIEASDRPVAAALFGTVLGGGLELAMACHIRIARPDTVFGLPEIKLGIIPGSLGTQRLPRLAGVAIAYDMISTGDPVTATFARDSGIVDALADDHVAATRAAVRKAALTGRVLRRTSMLRVPDPASLPEVVARARAAAAARPWLLAYGELERCLTAAATQDFREGERIEAESFGRLRPSAQSRAQRHIFFAERAAARGPARTEAKPRRIGTVAVVGADSAMAALGARASEAGLSVVAIAQGAGMPADADIVLLDGALPGSSPEILKLGRSEAIVLAGAPAASWNGASKAIVQVNATGDALELGYDPEQAPDVIPSASAFAKRIGVTPVVTAGGVGQAMQNALSQAVAALLAEGIPRARVDRILTSPAGFGNRFTVVSVASPAPGSTRSATASDADIFERLLAALVSRAASLLESGTAFRPGDIDILMVRGYGYANWKGGPVFMADAYGLAWLVERLDRAGVAVAPSLRQRARAGQRLSGWRRDDAAAKPAAN